MVTNVILIVLGTLSVLTGMRARRQSQAFAQWNQTTAQIQKSEAALAKTSVSFGRANYTVDLEYRYEVGGQEYVGTNLYALNAQRGWLKKDAEKMAGSLQGEIKIWYNPERPEESFVRPIGMLWIYLPMIIGLCLIGFGLVIS